MTRKVKSISLFKTKSKSAPKKSKKRKTARSKKKISTQEDKIYRKLDRKGIAKKFHIYQGGAPCASIALWHVDQGDLFDTTLHMLCKRANKTREHHYYHYTDFHFYKYDAWIMSQILKESMKKRDKKD